MVINYCKTPSHRGGVSLAGQYPAYDDIEFQYSITEEATHEVTITTDKTQEELQQAIEDGSITYSMIRDKDRGYLDPELYPFAFEGAPITEWLDDDDQQVIQVTAAVADGSNLKLTIETIGTEYYNTRDPQAQANPEIGKVYSIDHTNNGAWLDKCGYYDFTALIAGEAISSAHAKVVPYDSYSTPYELFDEIEALKDYDGSRYVEVGSIGQTSTDHYQTPYVIVAGAEADVDAWLAYTELSEDNPTQVLADLKAGKYDDLAVPVYVSNCHTNENSAVNGIMNFIQALVTEDEVTLKKMLSYTDEGEATLAAEKENFGTSISELYEPFASELGRLRGEYGDNGASYGYSTLIEDFDKYYNMGVDEFSIDELLDDVFFICVPTMNMEGYMQQTRATGMAWDPNRDYANQTMYEDRNAMAFMTKWNPMVYTEIHGRVEGMLVEPCGAPHNPNIEYDLIAKQFIQLGEALGTAAVANNEKFNSYQMPARDYIEIDPDSPTGVQWGSPWDDLSTNYGSQFPVFYGTCGITWEMPAYDDITAEQVIPNGMLGQGRYVQENKIELLTNQALLFERGVTNANSNDDVAKYYVDQYDEPGAQADIMRPVYDGEGENGNFYPECLIIPLDKENQRNIQDAAEAVLWIARNGMEYMIADEAFTYDGVEYPAGTIVASMYQAKRSLLNANFGPGTFVSVWRGLYSEAFSQHPYARGFDIITVAEPAAYKEIAAACADGYGYAKTLAYFGDFAAQFSGVEGADVIISNASEDSAGAVNALLKAGKTVAMVTEGEYMGDFICSYEDFLTIAKDYLISAEGVYGSDIKASVIEKSPSVYVAGWYGDRTSGNVEVSGGFSYDYYFSIYALEQMGFGMTEQATKADAIVGHGFSSSEANDTYAFQAVKEGTPYMTWGSGSRLSFGGETLADGISRSTAPNGTDMLAYVEYPTVNLMNANYALDEDYLNYQYGTAYFATIPEGAVALMQNSGDEPIVGCVGIFNQDDQAAFNVYNNAVVAFEYQQDGMDIVAFANSLTHKGHPQDEFKYIANFLFSRSLADEAYVGTSAPVDDDDPTQEPGEDPSQEPGEDPTDKPDQDKTDADVSKTGDATLIMTWIVLLAVAGGAGTVVIWKRRKN